MSEPNDCCVLVVDDVAEQREIYRAILQHAGFRVLEAGDGGSAVRLAGEHLPDLVLLDLGIPGLNGWEVARRLKAEPRTARIPLVALTAHALPEDQRGAEEAGCDAYLAKPIAPADALAVVQQQIALAGSR